MRVGHRDRPVVDVEDCAGSHTTLWTPRLYFAADEGPPDTLMATLDHGVVVVDPRIGEAAAERRFAGLRSIKDFERTAARELRAAPREQGRLGHHARAKDRVLPGFAGWNICAGSSPRNHGTARTGRSVRRSIHLASDTGAISRRPAAWLRLRDARSATIRNVTFSISATSRRAGAPRCDRHR